MVEDLFEDLDLIEVEEIESESMDDRFVYPCLLLSGIQTVEELEFFAKREYDPLVALPIFVRFDGITKQLGYFNVGLDDMRLLHFIAPYKLTLLKDPINHVDLDLNKPETFINMIRLK